MRGRNDGLVLVAGALLLAACGEARDADPTAPNFANAPPGACATNTVASLARTEFGANSAEVGYANDMKSAGGGTNQATYDGYRILQSIGNKYDGNTNPQTPMATATAASLALESFRCMKLGNNPKIPSLETLNAALGVFGAFGVRGFVANDIASVFSHDAHTWVLQPPPDETWQDITTLNTGITDTRISKAMTVYGVRTNFGDGFSDDQLVNPVVFDWSSLPGALFTSSLGGVIVGECSNGAHFMQHLPAGAGAEVTGYVDPLCFGEVASIEAPARSFAERVFRFLRPQPLQAALVRVANTGTGKGSLSPYAVIDPGSVNLTVTRSPSTKTNIINKILSPAPKVTSFTAGGTQFQQASILVYLKAVSNNGTPGQICYNWDYTDDAGVALFDRVRITKAGGYQLFAQTVGTETSPEGTEQPVPFVEPGNPDLSDPFQLKNDNSLPGVCPMFDGTFFYPDIVGDPTNKSQVFPPE